MSPLRMSSSHSHRSLQEQRLTQLQVRVADHEGLLGILTKFIGSLMKRHAALREQHDSLCAQHRALSGCLHRSGFVAKDRLQAELQACLRARNFSRLLNVPAVAQAIVLGAGPHAVQGLARASRACTETLEDALSVCLSEAAPWQAVLDDAAANPALSDIMHAFHECSRAAAGFRGIARLPKSPQSRNVGSSPKQEARRCRREPAATIHDVCWEPNVAAVFAAAMGKSTAQRFRATSRISSQSVRAAPSLQLLKDIWQHSELAEAIFLGLDPCAVHRFQVTSPAGYECMDYTRMNTVDLGSPLPLRPPVHGALCQASSQAEPGAETSRSSAPPAQPQESAMPSHTEEAEISARSTSARFSVVLRGEDGRTGDPSRPRSAPPNLGQARASRARDVSKDNGEFVRGDPIEVFGLRSRPDLNGQRGHVLRRSSDGSRWHVALPDGKHLRARLANLRRLPGNRVRRSHSERSCASTGGQLAKADSLPLGQALRRPRDTASQRCGRSALRRTGVSVRVADFAGPSEARSLKAASQSTARALMVRSRLYVVGGCDRSQHALDCCECFNPRSGVWQALPVMSQQRYAASMAAIHGFLYICGGIGNLGIPCRTTERLSFSEPARGWQSLPDMCQGRFSAISGVLAGSFYICGGRGRNSLPNTSESFDPTSSVWRPVRPMIHPRYNASSVVVGSCLYACGGYQDGGKILKLAERYDSVAGCWEQLPPMRRERACAAVAASKQHVYLCGGIDSEFPLNSVEHFDIAAGIWEELPPMRCPRSGGMVTAALPGRIYVFGGHDGWQALNSVECFKVDERSWEDLAYMAGCRVEASIAVMSGKFYLCGGHDSHSALCSAERFDPIRNTWEVLPPMLAPRIGGCATSPHI